MRPGPPPHNIDQPSQPFIVDQDTFDQIRLTKSRPRDRVVRGAMDSINSFLPMLLYPRSYDTTNAQKLWGGPLPWPDWKETMVRMLRYCGYAVKPVIKQPMPQAATAHAAA